MFNWKRINQVIVSLTLILNFFPVELIHQLIEEHEHEVHLCENDFCIREFSAKCELTNQILPKKYTLESKPKSSVFIPLELAFIIPETDILSGSRLISSDRAPPATNFSC